MFETGFSGFPGATITQIYSSRSRLRARFAIWRCPSCAGLNDPPSSPMRDLRLSPNRGRGSGTHLAVSANRVTVDRQLLQPDGAARVHPAGRDADLGAKSKFATVAKLGRSVPESDGT